MQQRHLRAVGIALVLVLALAGALLGTRGRGDSGQDDTGRGRPTGTAVLAASQRASAAPGAAPTATPVPQRTAPAPTATKGAARNTPPPPKVDSGLPSIPFAQLPPQAQETIQLIERGGPFPYDRDGIAFGNRERLLPLQPNGYYREYTVITPGSPDRGARRIIAGQTGEYYYTDDHYESFMRVQR